VPVSCFFLSFLPKIPFIGIIYEQVCQNWTWLVLGGGVVFLEMLDGLIPTAAAYEMKLKY